MANYLLSENAQKIMTYLQDNPMMDLTYLDLGDVLGIDGRRVNGTLNGLQRKGYISREAVEGFDNKVIRLTPDGENVDVYAEKEEE